MYSSSAQTPHLCYMYNFIKTNFWFVHLCVLWWLKVWFDNTLWCSFNKLYNCVNLFFCKKIYCRYTFFKAVSFFICVLYLPYLVMTWFLSMTMLSDILFTYYFECFNHNCGYCLHRHHYHKKYLIALKITFDLVALFKPPFFCFRTVFANMHLVTGWFRLSAPNVYQFGVILSFLVN